MLQIPDHPAIRCLERTGFPPWFNLVILDGDDEVDCGDDEIEEDFNEPEEDEGKLPQSR